MIMGLAMAVAAVFTMISTGMAQSLNGRWDATIQYDDLRIPFLIEFAGEGSQLRASFFNGDERVTSTEGTFDGKSAVFRFDHYATQLQAWLEDGVLKGTYGGKRSGNRDFEARPHQETAPARIQAPDIAGVWDVP